MLSRRNFSALALISAGALLMPAKRAAAIETVQPLGFVAIITAIAEVYGKIRDYQASVSNSARLDEILERLEDIQNRLASIEAKIDLLPEIIRQIVWNQYQSEEVRKYRAIGATIISNLRSGKPDKRIMSENVNLLDIQKFLVDDFGLFSSLWIGEIFSFQMLGLKIMENGRSMFDDKKRATLNLLQSKSLSIQNSIRSQDETISSYEDFCRKNESVFLGYSVSFPPDVQPITVSHYLNVHDCLLPSMWTEYPFRVGSVNPLNRNASPLWPDAAAAPLTEDWNDVRKEAFNAIIRPKHASFLSAQEAKTRLTEGLEQNKMLSSLIEKQRF